MTTNRRVLCGVAGALLLLYVVVIFQTNHTHQRFVCNCCVAWYLFPEPFATIASYIVSAADFYLLSAAAVGNHLRSRYWYLYLIIAHILAAALVGGLHLCWELFPPEPGAWIED